MTFEEWWKQQIDVPIHKSPILTKTHEEIARLAWEAAVKEYLVHSTIAGHGKTCAFCGEKCSVIHAKPSRWPVAFTHPGDNGVVRWHHIGCVQDKIFREFQETAKKLADMQAYAAYLEKKYDHQRE